MTPDPEPGEGPALLTPSDWCDDTYDIYHVYDVYNVCDVYLMMLMMMIV